MTSFNPPQRSDIWVMSVNGSGKHRLTRTAPLESSPSWSSDGKRIAYARYPGIWVMTANGRLRHPITVSASPGFDFFPAWSPDGSRIAFVSSRGGGLGDIWLMQADGSHSVQLTSNSRDDTRPCWSPDGRWLAFTSDRRPSGVYHIWVMRSNSTGLRRLTAGRTGEYSPSWGRTPLVGHSAARASS
jgi:TolB protein